MAEASSHSLSNHRQFTLLASAPAAILSLTVKRAQLITEPRRLGVASAVAPFCPIARLRSVRPGHWLAARREASGPQRLGQRDEPCAGQTS